MDFLRNLTINQMIAVTVLVLVVLVVAVVAFNNSRREDTSIPPTPTPRVIVPLSELTPLPESTP